MAGPGALHKNNTEIFAERKKKKQKQQMCLGTMYALLIRAEIAEISLQAQPKTKVADRQTSYKNNVPKLLIKQLLI